MSPLPPNNTRVALACGGTGGHLFPGLAVAEQLLHQGCEVLLLVSRKEVDQQAIKQAPHLQVESLPAVGLTRGRALAFFAGFAQSYRATLKLFRSQPPQAALAMGGFTSAPPLLAARRLGARTFLHESNTIPGRANRWLSWIVTRAFVGFPSAATRLHTRRVTVTGTPVRPQFELRETTAARLALGLDATWPVVLVMGGSQGAVAINHLLLGALPLVARLAPQWQWIHLCGPAEVQQVQQAYDRLGLKALVRPFFEHMALALGAASAAVSRAGASSLAELAAMRVPAVLVPYPAATDNHQWHNARAFEQAGAARLLDQASATPEELLRLLIELVQTPAVRDPMQAALGQWHSPLAARQIAATILSELEPRAGRHSQSQLALVPRRCS